MLDKIILGLLQFGPHSSYSLQKAMEQSTSFFYGASQGSISPALKKLVKAGLIQGQSQQDGGRKRIEYSLTAKGQEAFDSWVGSDFSVGRVRDDSLVRLFFLGHVAKSDRATLINQYCDELQEQKAALNDIVSGIEANLGGRSLTDVESFRMQTLQFGIAYYKFSIEWYKRLANEHQAT